MHTLILLIFLTFLPPAPTPQTPNFTRAADYSTKLVGQAVLVQQGGQVIFERYDNNWSADAPHPLASGTESFTGVAACLPCKTACSHSTSSPPTHQWGGAGVGLATLNARQSLAINKSTPAYPHAPRAGTMLPRRPRRRHP